MALIHKMSNSYPAVLVFVPPPSHHSLQLSLIEKPQNSRKDNLVYKQKELIILLVRVIELVSERTALGDGQSVGLPAELVSNLFDVAADPVLVANISRVGCE